MKIKYTLLLALFLTSYGIALSYSGGSGTKSSPYIISDIHDLKELMKSQKDWDKHFIMNADIDCAGHTDLSPIGADFADSLSFTGDFNGMGHTIYNLSMNRVLDYVNGLFGYIRGSVSNLNLIDVKIEGKYRTGALVGFLIDGTVSNCHVTGKINYESYDPGAGFNFCGGMCGHTLHGKFYDCSADVDLKANATAGGFVGASENATIMRCSATGDVFTNGNNVGGFVGGFTSTYLKDCYAWGKVTGVAYVGGFAGVLSSGYAWGTMINSYSTGKVSGKTKDEVGGFCGFNPIGNVVYCYFDILTSWQQYCQCTEGKTTYEMKQRATFESRGWDFKNVWIINPGQYPILRKPEVLADVSATELQNISLYPNPSQDVLHIDIRNDVQLLIIEIIDLYGKTVSMQKISDPYIVDISFLSHGVYYLKISDKLNTYIKPFIKE